MSHRSQSQNHFQRSNLLRNCLSGLACRRLSRRRDYLTTTIRINHLKLLNCFPLTEVISSPWSSSGNLATSLAATLRAMDTERSTGWTTSFASWSVGADSTADVSASWSVGADSTAAVSVG